MNNVSVRNVFFALLLFCLNSGGYTIQVGDSLIYSDTTRSCMDESSSPVCHTMYRKVVKSIDSTFKKGNTIFFVEKIVFFPNQYATVTNDEIPQWTVKVLYYNKHRVLQTKSIDCADTASGCVDASIGFNDTPPDDAKLVRLSDSATLGTIWELKPTALRSYDSCYATCFFSDGILADFYIPHIGLVESFASQHGMYSNHMTLIRSVIGGVSSVKRLHLPYSPNMHCATNTAPEYYSLLGRRLYPNPFSINNQLLIVKNNERTDKMLSMKYVR